MRFSYKWCFPILLRLLSLSQEALAASTSGLHTLRSVHLVGGFYVGLATSPTDGLAGSISQPCPHLSLEDRTFVQLSSHELSLPIMPLHLLGKKSWNVYNTANIERVRRDEAIARAKEEAEEQRMQELDAARRIAILRGEEPPSLQLQLTAGGEDEAGAVQPRAQAPGRERRKRKRAGENDTDFEMRVAKEQRTGDEGMQLVLRKAVVDAPLLDEKGHIDLFPEERPKGDKGDGRKDRAEKELERRKKEYADNYTVRFADAAGFKQGLEGPWYSSGKMGEGDREVPSKDVWGNEDPRRREREAARIMSSDPLAAMKQGAAKVRQVARERKQWQEERDREMLQMRKEREKRGISDEEDDLESFSLDVAEKKSGNGNRSEERRSRHSESRRRSHRHRSRERDRSRERHKHRHRHNHRGTGKDRVRDEDGHRHHH